MRVGVIDSTQNDVTLASPRAILDGVNSRSNQAGSPNVVGRNITMTAGNNGIASDPNEISGAGGVGTPADFLTVQANADGVDAAGNIGTLSITDINALPVSWTTASLSSNLPPQGGGTYGVFVTGVKDVANSSVTNGVVDGDLPVNEIVSTSDVTLTTTDGSILDGRGNGNGVNSTTQVVPPNVIANNIDLSASGSIGKADGSSDLKIYSAANQSGLSPCGRSFSFGYQDANYQDATSTERSVTASCAVSAQAGGSVYLTETPGATSNGAEVGSLFGLNLLGSSTPVFSAGNVGETLVETDGFGYIPAGSTITTIVSPTEVELSNALDLPAGAVVEGNVSFVIPNPAVTAPMDVLLAWAKDGNVRLTTTETGVDGGTTTCSGEPAVCTSAPMTAGNDILLVHSGRTLVTEGSKEMTWGAGVSLGAYGTTPALGGLIEAQSGNVKLDSAHDRIRRHASRQRRRSEPAAGPDGQHRHLRRPASGGAARPLERRRFGGRAARRDHSGQRDHGERQRSDPGVRQCQ
jgi:hypothetical protein